MSEIAEGKLAWPQAHDIGMRLAYKIGSISTKRKKSMARIRESTENNANTRKLEETIGKSNEESI